MSTTDSVDPNLATRRIDREEPMRAMLRRDSEEPN